MPTQRDDAAYKLQYRTSRLKARKSIGCDIAPTLGLMLRNVAPVYPVRTEAMIDAYTDILMERGLCSDVLNWHTRPATPPELEW